MSQTDYLIATTYLKLLLNEPDLIQVLQRTIGDNYIELFDHEYVQGAQIQAVFEAFADAGLDSWVLKFGQSMGSAAHGPLGFAVLSAPNLLRSLEVFTDYSSIRTTAYSSNLVARDQRLFLIAEDKTGSPLISRWLIENGMRAAQRLIENVMAHPLGNNALVRFAHPTPGYASKLRDYFQIPIEFNAGENSFSIPASWGQIPSPLSDPGTFQSNLNKCKELKHALHRTPDVLESVRITLDQFFNDCIAGNKRPSQLPTLNRLANSYALSPRTFARKMELHGSSYKHELEAQRCKHARALLENTHLKIADIAYFLGYQEPANFTRAFKNWFNTTPKQWRQALNKHRL